MLTEIKMLKTDTCMTAAGVRQVFGPRGKIFIVDGESAKTLIERKSAELRNPPKPKTPASAETE